MMEPVGDRIFVAPNQEEDQTESGLYVVKSDKEKPTHGRVVAVSRTIAGPRPAVGASVLFQKYAGTEFEMDGRELIVLDVKDVLAVGLTV